MKTLLAAVAAMGALALAAPAHADPYRAPDRDYVSHRGYDRGYGDYRGHGADRPAYVQRFTREDLFRLERRIDWGFQSGALTRREANFLANELYDLRQRARYYWRTEGISWRERQDLELRYERLSYRIRQQVLDDDRRYRDDRYDRYGHR